MAVPTVGSIRRGATLEEDIIHQYIHQGRFTLVLEDAQADWSWAKTIAEIINEESNGFGQMEEFAIAIDPKNVVVRIPPEEQVDPAGFIARVENLRLLMPESEARVVINRKSETVVITGDVEIAPVVISHQGLTITVTEPPMVHDATNPKIEQQQFVGLATPKATGGIRLADLRDQLNLLKVPAKDQIEIIEELYRTGRLYGKLIVEE
jgi:flagellar P-ring protein precursor FlgI